MKINNYSVEVKQELSDEEFVILASNLTTNILHDSMVYSKPVTLMHNDESKKCLVASLERLRSDVPLSNSPAHGNELKVDFAEIWD
ncbi:hypothetical protein [Deinococcus roseus]|uniref:Antitoxin n=1 Tax=Deinococcus roseus TaxID=392414 RepID=A0ABQ2DC98_9DEIO|nr:hypothetical protein [Deinococcus roseus]GGJ49464.1 hypothetical protein GCM10008938_39310 [Deinococcus roseus]